MIVALQLLARLRTDAVAQRKSHRKAAARLGAREDRRGRVTSRFATEKHDHGRGRAVVGQQHRSGRER